MGHLSIEEKETEVDTTLWYLVNSNSGEKTNLAELIEEDEISNAEIIEDDFIQVSFTDYGGYEVICLLNSNKKIITKAMAEPVVEFIKTRNEFIVVLNAEAGYFEKTSAHEDGYMYAVIDSYGEYVIEPKFMRIEYNETHGIYICDERFYIDNEEDSGIIIEDYEDFMVVKHENKLRILNNGNISEIQLDTIDNINSPFDGIFQNSVLSESFKISSLNPREPITIKDCLIASIDGKFGIINSQGEIVIDFMFVALENKSELTKKTNNIYSIFAGKYINGVCFCKQLNFDDTLTEGEFNGNFSFIKFLNICPSDLQNIEEVYFGFNRRFYTYNESEGNHYDAPDLIHITDKNRLNNSSVYNHFLIFNWKGRIGALEVYSQNINSDSSMTILDINTFLNFSYKEIRPVYSSEYTHLIGFLLNDLKGKICFTPVGDSNKKIYIKSEMPKEILEEIRTAMIYDTYLMLSLGKTT